MEQFLEVIQSWVNVKGEPYKHAFIMDNQGRGNITVEIYKDDFGSKFGYIANLWVKGEYRKCGLGDLLLKRAEEIAKDNGCEYVELDWAFRNSPYWVYDWYERNGYIDSEFGNKCARMVKRFE